MPDPDSRIWPALCLLDRWLDSVCGPRGYGGPVAHWWRQSLLYAGPGFDWRYEGIISGYLLLWGKTRQAIWLEKARLAGDHLLAGQLEDQHYAASNFEINPASGGTPHEAAADLALLRLAQALKTIKDPSWDRYAQTAQDNLQAYYLDRLWHPDIRAFQDAPGVIAFVPNKAATACEAFFLLAEIRADDRWVAQYVVSTLETILDYQAQSGSAIQGGIAQNSIQDRLVEKYFPYYTSRCIPALVKGYQWTRDERFLDAAIKAMNFIQRARCPDGSYPQVLYPAGRVNRYPQWVAGIGDILHAQVLLEPFGVGCDIESSLNWLLAGQTAAGGIKTGHGFASQVSQKPPGGPPDFRDLLPVTGWIDKAFRFLVGRLPDGFEPPPGPIELDLFESLCTFKRRHLFFKEDHKSLQVSQKEKPLFKWRKGTDWVEAAPEFWTI